MGSNRVFGGVVIVCLASACSSGSSSSPSGGGSSGASNGASSGSDTSSAEAQRATASCSTVMSTIVTSQGGTTAPGSWGALPTALQRLPAGGTLCGAFYNTADDGGQGASYGTAMLTDLWGQDLLNFYAPLAKSLGCTRDDATVAPDASFSCTNGAVLVVAPDVANDVILVAYAGP
jgi:hypothetical protein